MIKIVKSSPHATLAMVGWNAHSANTPEENVKGCSILGGSLAIFTKTWKLHSLPLFYKSIWDSHIHRHIQWQHGPGWIWALPIEGLAGWSQNIHTWEHQPQWKRMRPTLRLRCSESQTQHQVSRNKLQNGKYGGRTLCRENPAFLCVQGETRQICHICKSRYSGGVCVERSLGGLLLCLLYLHPYILRINSDWVIFEK